MSNVLRYSGTNAQARNMINRFVGALAGRSGDYSQLVRGVKLRVGMVALACIQEAFLAKAAGGTGEDGIAWAALKKSTIANRRVGPGDIPGLKAAGITKRKFGFGARRQGAGDLDSSGRLKRGFLTDAQNKRWKMIFATRLTQFMARHGMGHAAAAARAGAIAWATLKAEGAKTKLEVLGNRKVMIGRDTGRLFNSLSPGVAGVDAAIGHPILNSPPEPIGADESDRVLREDPGAVIVGTNVVYAGKFHSQRPLWPVGDLPQAWSERIVEAARSGVLEAITMILGGHG